MKPGSITIPILRLGYNGEGVGSLNGLTVFVPGALPGENVRARVVFSKKTYTKAALEDVLSPSPERSTPPCPLFGVCGGCQIMHMRYKAQLNFKEAQIKSNLEKIGRLQGAEVRPCLPSPQCLHYRNKIEVPFRRLGSRSAFGFYRFESHDIVPFDRCFVHCEEGDRIFSAVRRIVLESGIHAYQESLHNKSLRHLLIKTAVNAKQALAVLVSNGYELKRLREVSERIMACHPFMKGVVQNINQEVTNVILGNKSALLRGADHIVEQMEGLKFNITASSFFQINPFQIPGLLKAVAAAARLSGGERVLDAYSGVGLFSLSLAPRAKEVIGVESVYETVNNASRNAEANGIKNVSFLCGRAERVCGSLKRIDTVITDPPRAGCDEGFLKALLHLRPGRIVYVSCNPATLARDLEILCQNRYKLEYVQPVDMFPQTAHVECVAAVKRI